VKMTEITKIKMSKMDKERYERGFLFVIGVFLFVGASSIFLGLRYHPCPMVDPASPNSTVNTNCLTPIHYNPFTNLGNLSAIIAGILLIIMAIIAVKIKIDLVRHGKNNGGD